MTNNLQELIDQARAVDVADAALRLGIHVKGSQFAGSCPACGGKDRFWINTRRNAWGCRRCGTGGDGIALIMNAEGCDFLQAVEILTDEKFLRRVAEQPARPTGPDPDDEKRKRRAQWYWNQSKPACDSPVEKYLRGRGLSLPIPGTIRYLPKMDRGHIPHCMISAFGLPNETEPGVLSAPEQIISVHLTFLNPEGTAKQVVSIAEEPATKIMIGFPEDLPIAVSPVSESGAMSISEGIENAMAEAQAMGWGAWAAGSAPRLPKLAKVLPDYVKTVTLYPDPDPDGRMYSRRLGEALLERGIEVYIEE